MERDNISSVLSKFSNQLNIPINIQDVYNELLIHPDYPSLLAISDVLTNYGVKNSAFRIDLDQIHNTPCPFIAHTNNDSGDFLVVEEIKENSVYISNHKFRRHILNKKELGNIFSGVILTAEYHPKKDKNILKYLDLFRNCTLIYCFAISILLACIYHANYFINISLELIFLTVFKSAGLLISVLLLVQSFDNDNPLVQKLCRSWGENNCKDILPSKAAKVFDGLNWSEVGFFYFSGTWILSFFTSEYSNIWFVLRILNLISLPYTAYSIYFQARKAKSWCILCCIIQLLLWMEFIVLNYPKHIILYSPYYGLKEFSLIYICLLLPALLWIIIRPFLKKVQKSKSLLLQLNKFKFNKTIFNNLLKEQPKFDEPNKEWSIVLGNTSPDNVITMVSNPHCSPCKNAYSTLQSFLLQNKSLQVRIIFPSGDNANNEMVKYFMYLQGHYDEALIQNAFNNWYKKSKVDVDLIQNINKDFQISKVINEKIKQQNLWCLRVNIKVTPTFLLNGHRLPNFYKLEDLKYLLL